MTQWKITFVIGIIMFSIGIPLFIVGNITDGEDNLAMIIPGAIVFDVGALVAIVTATIGMGFGKWATTSEQDPANKNWWED